MLPYHNYAGSKYAALDIENTLPKILLTQEEIKKAENMLETAQYVSEEKLKEAS